MVFSTVTFFLFFLTILLALSAARVQFFNGKYAYSLPKIRHSILLVASYIFCGWWNWYFCVSLFLMTTVVYFCAIGIVNKKYRMACMFLSVVIPLVTLGYFKYSNFFLESISQLIGDNKFDALNIILPIGLSFYTFQSIGYAVDVYRGKTIPVRCFVKFALYIAFFPKLISGPIVRTSQFLPQLDEDRNVSVSNIMIGSQIFIFGLAKKIIFADYLAVFVNQVYAAPLAFHSITVILAVIAYSIQIYFDFSGYSDMAIGCAKCLGYDLPKNFNLPYMSKSITEFWKRWHISLSSWLQEYLYFSLGGNKKGVFRTYLNLMTTMVLGGLWHGASWTFVCWGIVHGFALCVHKASLSFISQHSPKQRPESIGGGVLKISCVYIFVSLAWIPFRAPDLSSTYDILYNIFFWHDGIVHVYSWVLLALIAITICTMLATSVIGGRLVIEGFYPVLNLSRFFNLAIFLFSIGIILGVAYTGQNPFIYFQF